MRIIAPTYFQTPNDLVDHWLPHLGEAETKVLLVIIRKTFGWQKQRDRISLSQLEKLTGHTRSNVVIAVKSLVGKGLIIKETYGNNGTQETWYELAVEDSNNSDQYCSNTPPSIDTIPPPVLQQYPQKKLSKDILEKQQQAAVFSDKKPKAETSKFYPVLEKEDCLLADKIWLTENFSEDDIIHAIKFADAQKTYSSSRIACIKWAAKEKPEIKRCENDLVLENKKYAQHLKATIANVQHVEFEVLSSYVEIYSTIAQKPSTCIDYTQKDFKEQINMHLRKHGYKL